VIFYLNPTTYNNSGLDGASISVRITDSDVTASLGAIDKVVSESSGSGDTAGVSPEDSSKDIESRVIRISEEGIEDVRITTSGSAGQVSPDAAPVNYCEACKDVAQIACSVGCRAGAGSICVIAAPIIPFAFGTCVNIVRDVCDVIDLVGCQVAAAVACEARVTVETVTKTVSEPNLILLIYHILLY